MTITTPPVQITDGLWMLAAAPYPLYLLTDQNQAAIVEGGIGPMAPLLGEQLEQLDIDPATIRQVLVTHAHPDHVMAVPVLREMLPGVAVCASAAAAGTLAAEEAISFFCKIDEALTESLLNAQVIREEHRGKPLAEMQIPVDRTLGEGETVEIGGITLNVLETPGHSDCSLSFHEPQRKILLAADATGYYIPQHHYWWPNYFTGYQRYLDSMRRLAGLDAEILCLGHNAVIQGADEVAAYFRDALSATEDYHARIVDDGQAGGTVRQIAESLGSEAYEKTPLLPLEFFQKNCGVMVKQSARHEGITIEKK